ncbi:NADP-dependent oxidoreductase [Enterovirga sp. CN4-39]|uniref:NADP-dependent oxidoreductase n=1 Tax=Enterovirga sp. CN4-39 TaxID=3400910 RepID=UPI003C0BCD8B
MTSGPNAASKSMRAWRVHAFGGPDAMSLEAVKRPEPGPGEVLVQVHAAGVGPWDAWIRAGRSALPQPLPLTPGSDLAGVVAGIGPEVRGLGLGEAVFGVTNPRFVGAYAEYALAEAAMIARMPARLSFQEAASVPVVSITAWQALFEEARLKAGQTVLIHGAGGNVGGYAVQFGRRAGLRVVATASSQDAALVKELGAEKVIDYRRQRFEDEIDNVDAVIDLVGGETQARSFAVLRPGGALISTVSEPDQRQAGERGISAAFFLVAVTSERLTRIAELLDAGELKTRIGAVLPFSQAWEAHEMMEDAGRAPKGKIVLQITGR